MATPNCKICASPTTELCAVDLNYAVSSHERFPLGHSGEEIKYFQCVDCQFVFTNYCDDWSDEEFTNKIYNDDYIKVDPDYAGKRPREMAAWTTTLIAKSDHHSRILDYGGGVGILSEELRNKGYSNAITWDPYTSKDKLTGRFDIITSYEVFEHNLHPEMMFSQLSNLLNDEGVLFVSTFLVPDDMKIQKEKWWYIGPRNGHISIYSARALKIMSARHGLRCWTSGDSFHVLAKDSQLPSNNHRLAHLATDNPWVCGHQPDRENFYTFLRGRFQASNWQVHYDRYIQTIDRLWNYINCNSRVIEFGGISPVTAYFRGFAKLESYEGDLRYPLELESDTCDVVLMLESAEHIRYREDRSFSASAISALQQLDLKMSFQETYRILNPGGVMIVTTPNICSVTSIARIVAGRHPFEPRPHIREYSPQDLRDVATKAGFSLEVFSTFFSLMPDTGVDRQKISDAINTLGGAASDRGDTMFFVFRKPI